MRKLTSRFIIVLFTFFIGISSAAVWFDYWPRRAQEPAESHSTNAPKAVQHIESEWQKVAGTGFTFYLPSDMRQDDTHCMHTQCAKFSNGKVEIKFSYGTVHELTPNVGYAAKYQPQYKELQAEISGSKAEISTHYDDLYIFRYVAWVHFPDVGDGKTHLSMKAFCNEPRDLDTAKLVFSTVEFHI